MAKRKKKDEKPRYRVKATSVPTRLVEHGENGSEPRVTAMTGISNDLALLGARSLTPEEAEAVLAQHVKGYAAPKPTNEHRAPDGEFTSPAKEATLAMRKDKVKEELRAEHERKQEDRFFKAMEGVGITMFLQAFFAVVGAGAGAATIYWAVSRISL